MTPTPELPKTKRELRRMLHRVWERGVMDAQARLEREAERSAMSNVPRHDELQDAAEMLNGLILRGRGGR